MGVTEFAPDLYHSTFSSGKQQKFQIISESLLICGYFSPRPVTTSAEDGSKCIDLGCYEEKGPAAVAVDLMAFRFQWNPAEDRRLPSLDHLEHSVELYNKISRQIIKELSLTTEELAVKLKCQLARQLFQALGVQPQQAGLGRPSEAINFPLSAPEVNHMTDDTGPYGDHPSKKPKFSFFGPKEVQAQHQAVVEPSLSTEGDLPSFIPIPGLEKSQSAAVLREYTDTNSELVKDIFHMWIKGAPEFPPGSGTYPVFVKEGPLKQGYFTLVRGTTRALLHDATHGEITLTHVDDRQRSWNVSYFVKDPAHREVGNVS
jgi:hypothetical protein